MREASNPMRLILEAAKIRRKPQEAEPPATVVAPAAAPLPPRRVVVEAPPSPTAVLARLPAPPAQASAMAAGYLPATAGAILPVNFSPAIATAPAVSRLANATPAAAPSAASSSLPRLLSQVAPDIPSNVMRRVGSLSELLVQLTINRDGSVSDVSVVPQAYRAVEPYVAEALRQWRFEPQPQASLHRLRLVFNEGR